MDDAPFGLVAHPEKPGAAELVRGIRGEFERLGKPLVLEEVTAALIGDDGGLSAGEMGRLCGMILSLGGDGSLLRTVHRIWPHVVPIFGLNHGSLGFLTGISSADFATAVEALVEHRFVITERSLLEVCIMDEARVVREVIGLNDAVISRGGLSRLIQMDVKIDGVELTTYNADGLIVSTPTGSTAYSLAAGGPIVMPESQVFLLTPICPHVLTNRSLIFNNTSVIELDPCPSQTESFLTVDGMEEILLGTGNWLRIRRAEKKLPLATLPHMPFFELLRRKLKWSGSNV